MLNEFTLFLFFHYLHCFIFYYVIFSNFPTRFYFLSFFIRSYMFFFNFFTILSYFPEINYFLFILKCSLLFYSLNKINWFLENRIYIFLQLIYFALFYLLSLSYIYYLYHIISFVSFKIIFDNMYVILFPHSP